MRTLEGKTALITGAGRGFGLAIAEHFANAGANLALNYRASRDGCETVAEQVRSKGNRALVVQADLVDAEATKSMVESVIGEFGKIDILVNNAGIMHVSSFTDSSEKTWCSELDVNILGPLRLTHLVVPHMIQNEYGKIVNLSSQLALIGWERGSVYAGTKGFILTWTKCLARELGQYNINVNAIGPGSIPTDMNSSIYSSEAQIKEKVQSLPLRRLGTPHDVAESALFLASDASSFLTGQMLGPNGGNVM